MIPQLQKETAAAPAQIEPQWSLATRIGFRFAFSYFFLYLAPGAVGALGFNEPVPWYRAPWVSLWHQVVPWIAIHVLGSEGRFKRGCQW